MDIGDAIGWLRSNSDVLIAISSAIVALISAVIARGETRKQAAIQTERLRQSIDQSSLEWGNTAIDTMGRAATFARSRASFANEAAFQGQRLNLMTALSALIERGRMFFPNIDEAGKGADKDSAFRGTRPPILDAILWAYLEIECLTRDGAPTADNSADFITDCRRLMVSELQAHLDPRRRNEIVDRYDHQARAVRKDALKRSDELKSKLATRRPSLSIDGAPPSKETLQ